MNKKTIVIALLAAGVLGAGGWSLYQLGLSNGMAHAPTAAPTEATGSPAATAVDPSAWGIPEGEAATRRHVESGLKGGDVDPLTGRKILYYHDPMVPGKKFESPGKSPFMDMMLVPAYAGAQGADSGTVSVSSRIQQNLGVRTGEVVSGQLAPEVAAVGTVAWNERGQYLVQARATGFIEKLHVRAALEGASAGAVAEGAVGAGAGTVAFGWKGGIGTSSRVLPRSLGGYTVGVLVQSNFGGVLQVMGAPVGEALGRYAFKDDVDRERGDGSIMMVVATDAPLLDRNLERLAARAIMGLSRTGSSASNGSGDYVIAFSTAASVRRHLPAPRDTSRAASFRVSEELVNDATSALFQAVVEATEEAIYNSLFAATSVRSNARTVEALPLDEVRRILQQHGIRPR